mmetsp:Transcript_51101/g.119655  ORF Transcript_51101/g.119655 Transcript_51101/m.119655 type:complete len:627 (+) Transcript_51101:182-2062(+)
MGCVLTANKNIGDVKVSGAKASAGPGLAQYLHWRGAAIIFTAMLWIVQINCQVGIQAKVLLRTKESMPPAMREPMMTVVYLHAGAGVVCIISSVVGLILLILAFFKRRKHFAQSVSLVRKAYLLELGMPIAIYLIFPFAFFLRTHVVHQEVCTFSLWNIMRMGPVVREAFASAASMEGDLRLAKIAMAPPPRNYSEISTWEGEAWCKSKPNWLVEIFGPAPTMPKLGFQPITLGLVPQIVTMMEGMTGARCQTPGLDRPGARGQSWLTELGETLMNNQTGQNSKIPHLAHVGARLSPETGTSDECMRGEGDSCESVGQAVLAESSSDSSFGILMAQTVVCQFASAMSVMADGARIATLLMVNVGGFWCTAQAFRRTFPAAFTVMKGCRKAAVNVKSLMPYDTLPGYILIIAVSMFSPPLLVSLCTLSQALANPLFSMGMGVMMLAVVQDFYTGELMTHHTTYQKSMELIAPRLKWQKIYYFISALLSVAAVGLFILTASRINLTKIFDFKRMLSPDNIFNFLVSFLFGRSFARLVFTDFMLGAIFDIHDDDMRVKSGSDDIDSLNLLKEWYVVMGDKKAISKLDSSDYKDGSSENKKEEKYDSDSEDDHYDEEPPEDFGVPPPPPR